MKWFSVLTRCMKVRTLRWAGYRRQERNAFYCLKDSHVLDLYREVAEHLDEPEEY